MSKKSTKIIIISAVAMMISSCQEPILERSEVKFKKLNEYHLDDFKLNREIRYFEIIRNGPTSAVVARYGTSSPDNHAAKKYPLKRSSLTLMQRLHGAAYGMMMPPFYTVRYIETNGHEGMILEPKELKSFLGEIDTPAELQVWLSLTGTQPAYSYQKEKNGMYKVRWDFSLINDTGMCTHYRYKGLVNNHGKITTIIDREKPKLCSGSLKKV